MRARVPNENKQHVHVGAHRGHRAARRLSTVDSGTRRRVELECPSWVCVGADPRWARTRRGPVTLVRLTSIVLCLLWLLTLMRVSKIEAQRVRIKFTGGATRLVGSVIKFAFVLVNERQLIDWPRAERAWVLDGWRRPECPAGSS